MELNDLIGSPRSSEYSEEHAHDTDEDVYRSPVRHPIQAESSHPSESFSPKYHFSPRLSDNVRFAFRTETDPEDDMDYDEMNLPLDEDVAMVPSPRHISVSRYNTNDVYQPPTNRSLPQPQNVPIPNSVSPSPAPQPPPVVINRLPPLAPVSPPAPPPPPPKKTAPPQFPAIITPPPHLQAFGSGDLIYVSLVDKIGTKGKAQRRVLCVTSTAVLLFDPAKDPRTEIVKSLKRAVDLLHIKAMYISFQKRRASFMNRTETTKTIVQLQIPQQYDLVFQFLDEPDPPSSKTPSIPPQDRFHQILNNALLYRCWVMGLTPHPIKLEKVSNVLDWARLDRTGACPAYQGPVWALLDIECEQRHYALTAMTKDELLSVVLRLQLRVSELSVEKNRMAWELLSTKEELENVKMLAEY